MEIHVRSGFMASWHRAVLLQFGLASELHGRLASSGFVASMFGLASELNGRAVASWLRGITVSDQRGVFDNRMAGDFRQATGA